MNDAPNSPNKFGPWPVGLNTMAEPHALPRGSLHIAQDVEIDNQGYVTPCGYESSPAMFPRAISEFTFGSRTYSIEGNLIRYSLPFESIGEGEEEERVYNVLDIGGPVVMCVPLKNGLWVATKTATYFYAGKDALVFQPERTLDVGALNGTGLRLPDGRAIWTSPMGVMVGDDGGNAVCITAASLSPVSFASTDATDRLYYDAHGNLKYTVTLT